MSRKIITTKSPTGNAEQEGRESDFAQAVAELRKQCGKMSQFALAVEIGVSPTTVARWEAGSNPPDDSHCLALGNFASVKGKRAWAHFFWNKLPKGINPLNPITSEEIAERMLAIESGMVPESVCNKDAPVPDDPGTSPLTAQQRKNMRVEAHHWVDRIFEAPAPDTVIRKVIECVREEGGKWTRARDPQKK